MEKEKQGLSVMEKHFRADVKMRNNRLVAAREDLGLGAREAAEKIGIGYGRLLDFESFKIMPYGSRNELRPSAQRVCDFYGFGPDYFWEGEVAKIEGRIRRSIEIDLDTARQEFLPAENAMRLEEMKDQIERAMETLTERERGVIQARFYEEKSLDETGAETLSENKWLGLTGNRVMQIEAKALHKIRKAMSDEALRTA